MRKIILILFTLFFKTTLFAQQIKDATVSQIAKVENKHYKVILKINGSLSIYDHKNNLIQNFDQKSLHFGDAGLESLKFTDFNTDGHKDILIYYMTNVPGACDLILFNPIKRRFDIVSNFTSFFSPQIIKGKKVYYSYRRSGCADLDWNSDLFIIRNYNAIRIGNILGKECDDNLRKQIIITKIIKTNKSTIEQLPISILKKYKNFKWGFIKAYWTNNYNKFI